MIYYRKWSSLRIGTRNFLYALQPIIKWQIIEIMVVLWLIEIVAKGQNVCRTDFPAEYCTKVCSCPEKKSFKFVNYLY